MERQAFPFRPINAASGNKQQDLNLCLGVLKVSPHQLGLQSRDLPFSIEGSLVTSLSIRISRERRLPIRLRKMKDVVLCSYLSPKEGIMGAENPPDI